MEDFNTLMKRRAAIKGQLTRVYNFISSLPLELADISECLARQQKVHDLWKEFNVIQSKIEEADQSETQMQERDLFEAGYYRVLAEITKYITK